MLDDYLNLCGIQRWHERGQDLEGKFSRFTLLKASKPAGFLVLEQRPVQKDSVKLITALLGTVNFIWEMEEGALLTLESPELLSASLWIVMGQRAIDFIEKFSIKSGQKIYLPSPDELLTTPLEKRQVWQQLRGVV